MDAGINGNKHSGDEICKYTGGRLVDDRNQHPLPTGVAYLGDGDWDLPTGAKIRNTGPEDWVITLADGAEVHVWTEE